MRDRTHLMARILAGLVQREFALHNGGVLETDARLGVVVAGLEDGVERIADAANQRVPAVGLRNGTGRIAANLTNAAGEAQMMQTAGMRSSDVVTDKSNRESMETPDGAAGPSDARTLAAFERRIRLKESAVRQRFRQNVALAIIFALAALTLVVIVQVGHSP